MKKRDWKELRAGELMSTPIFSLEAGTTCGEAADRLTEHHVSGALVVDMRGEALGVISLFDIVNYVAGLAYGIDEPGSFYRYSSRAPSAGWSEDNPLLNTVVEDLMSPKVIWVDESDRLPAIVRLMSAKEIHRVFVASEGRPVGVISSMDVLRCLAGAKVTGRPEGRPV